MRTNSNLNYSPSRGILHRLSPTGDYDDGGEGDQALPRLPSAGDDLPYKVELWDALRASVEQVLAVTASGSIGYAAYYAATREFPDRYVTLRHKNSIISRWNPRGH